MDDAPETPPPTQEQFLVNDEQRDAAVAHLDQEHAAGAFDVAELQRRTTAVRASTTVAELLAATAPPIDPTATIAPSVVRSNMLALAAGLVVALLLALYVFSRLS